MGSAAFPEMGREQVRNCTAGKEFQDAPSSRMGKAKKCQAAQPDRMGRPQVKQVKKTSSRMARNSSGLASR